MSVAHSKITVHQRGENFVMHRLNDIGLTASFVPRRATSGHIEVLSPDKQRVIATLLVSARTDRSQQGWVMNEKHEFTSKPGLYYALVDLEPAEAVTYVVPSAVVSDWLKRDHSRWLKEDANHQDNPVRKLRFGQWLDPYREAWKLVRQESAVKP
jgi:hypothetical protein